MIRAQHDRRRAACGAGLQAAAAACVSMQAASSAGVFTMTQPGTEPDRIVLDDEQAVAAWAKRLDATPEELREAVQAVGDKAADVEMHLKGVRSTTNADRVRELGR
jgi:hypothetical protein